MRRCVATCARPCRRSSIRRPCSRGARRTNPRSVAGLRVHVIIPPLALKGPTITIRKFPRLLGLADLVRIGALSESAAHFLAAAVAARANIIVSGGTGSGKTTLLNALSEFIPDTER